MLTALAFIAGTIWGAIVLHGITEPGDDLRSDHSNALRAVPAVHGREG